MKQLQKYKDTGWVSLNKVVKYRVQNGQCTVNIFSSDYIKLTADNYTIIGTLPKHIAPTVQIEFCPHFIGEDTFGTRGSIDFDGSIKIYVNKDAQYYGASLSYPLG